MLGRRTSEREPTLAVGAELVLETECDSSSGGKRALGCDDVELAYGRRHLAGKAAFAIVC